MDAPSLQLAQSKAGLRLGSWFMSPAGLARLELVSCHRLASDRDARNRDACAGGGWRLVQWWEGQVAAHSLQLEHCTAGNTLSARAVHTLVH